MDATALAGLCALLARGAPLQGLPEGVSCPPPIMAPTSRDAAPGPASSGALLAGRVAAGDARDGIARVAYAEAANQGDSGLAAVVYTILNRLQDGRWGASIDSVLNAPHQFEPVLRAGGSWRNLPAVSEAKRARIDTIVNLALEGRLPDLTNGAQYFQNPRIVAARAVNGQVAANLVNFGGAAPSAVIGAHSFYVEPGRGGGRRAAGARSHSRGEATSDVVLTAAGGGIFVGENRAFPSAAAPADQPADEATTATSMPAFEAEGAGDSGDPARAIFVRADGRASAFRR
jgi:N-acetylmuramoyl-L-alanine amidase